MEKILVSACLLGAKVRYNGSDCAQHSSLLDQWLTEGRIITVCPEVAGGLATPRPPAEIRHGKVFTKQGKDVTTAFHKGAEKALTLIHQHHIKIALLKAKSPSCGNTEIYDGTFSDTKISGQGITAQLLIKHGIKVFNETQLNEVALFLAQLENKLS
ncbi:MAG: hypothetical protein A3E87_03380 [Gammaproteobacteria bacterium RIFCSPHIGHO2_12_FULL_35_23]|nr:MAG: hypothetical protein A3E87_03380 [Gammaproteobacteria bacterium RIFCSPHIGHO2_12_FULL_35_23]